MMSAHSTWASRLRQPLGTFFTLLILAVLAAIAIDSVGNPESSLKFLKLSSVTLVLPLLLTWAGVRIGWGSRIHPPVSRVLQWIALPTLILLTLALTAVDYYTPPNTVYAYTRLHQSRLGLLTICLLAVVLLNQSKTWWLQFWKPLLTVTPIIAFITMLTIHSWPFDIFLELIKEDRLIENLQFAVLALGGVWAGIFSWKHAARKDWLSTVTALGISLCLLLVAGNEISWMQRHLGIETPAAIAEKNYQNEITFHNLQSFEWLVGYSYLALGSFGSISPFIAAVLFRGKWKH